jgi:nucleoid-associated protein EbfC
MFGKDQLAGLMKQAKEMQDQMQEAQKKLADTDVLGESGAGLVKITMTAKFKVKNVFIDPSLFNSDTGGDVSEQIEMIQDLVAAAVNSGTSQIETITEKLMGKFAANMPNLPSGMPF